MHLISEVAKQVGLSRTTLLYYEKIGLIKGQRLANGYRYYRDYDVQRLKLLQRLQAGGLSLKECQACLEAKLERATLSERLAQLDQEIAQKQAARDLLAGLLGERSLRAWHESLNQTAPDAHLDWLLQQGFNEKDALRLKWLSKDMNEHDQYMQDFMQVFEPLERWGPGGEEETLRALNALPFSPRNILEIGSGKGLSTKALAEHSDAQITAMDNEPLAIEALQAKLEQLGFDSRVMPVCASMTALPFAQQSFDLLWAEGCVYIMGLQKALEQWKPQLKKDGILVVSDLVWLSDTPQQDYVDFWKGEYPDMQPLATRLAQFEQQGYEVLDHFSISQQAWKNYWQPLEARISELSLELEGAQALTDITREVELYRRHQGDQYAYHFFIARVL